VSDLRSLPPVRAEPGRVIRTTVGLRPFRPDGFVIRAERLGEKVVVHDYGHGGSGMSLCWGTAHMAIESAIYVLGQEAAVIGCGVIGLTTAILLQRCGVRVTIYSADEPPNTTSNVSGAFWAPFGLVDEERLTPEISERIVRASRLALTEFDRMVGDARYGVRRMPVYYIGDSASPTLGLEEALLPDLFTGEHFGPGEHPWGDLHVTAVPGLAIDPGPFMTALHEDFVRGGGRVVRRTFASRDEIATMAEPVIFNCSGLGSRVLAADEALIPLKGQLTLLEAQPEVSYMIAFERERVYMVPRGDSIVLGTSKVRGEWSLDVDARETERVVNGMRKLWAAPARGRA
jgi:D-amino-acid oxidase